MAPAEVVQLAKRSGLSAMALTDHDTIGGIAEAAEEAKKVGVDFLPGIEISAEFPAPGTLHLLGYGVDPQSAVLLDLTKQLLEGRDNRNPRMVARLNELGIRVTMQEWEAESGGVVLGRPHLAKILVQKGYVKTIKEAFDKYLGTTGAAYVDKERLGPQRAMELIRESGGVAVLAHPIQLRTGNDAELDRVVKDLVDLGLQGIEVIHSDHDAAWVEKVGELAGKYGLIKTGGSDFHGRTKEAISLGVANGRKVPREWYEGLVGKIKRRG